MAQSKKVLAAKKVAKKVAAKAPSVAPAVRKHLLAGIAKQSGVDALIVELDAARAGMYTHGILAAIAAKGDGTIFAKVCDTLRDEFRANVRGIAVKFNCDIAKDKQGKAKADAKGNPVYKVPSSLSSMASHIKSAFEFKIDLGTPSKPAPFSAVRDACQVARETKAKASASPVDIYRAGVVSQLDDIAAKLEGLDLPTLRVISKLLKSVAVDIPVAA